MRWYQNRRVVPLVGMVAAAALLVAAFILGLVSFGKMRQVVSQEFNQQQLVLAENLAVLIHQDLDFLRRELLVLNESPSLSQPGSKDWKSRLQVTLRSVQSDELLEIRYVDASGETCEVCDARGRVRLERGTYAEEPYFRWAQRPENRGRVYLGDRLPVEEARLGGRPLLLLATPHYPASRGGLGPHPPHVFSGVLLFVVDASALATRFTEDARSGTSGYAWVINEKGTFLAHPMRDFIGQNAFTARQRKDPRMGFEGINVIMRERMLKGQSGTGEYVSGWHRQIRGPVRKLIGFAPVILDHDRREVLWSVAVVAPVSEVQGMVRALFLRQFFVQTAIFLAILAGLLSLIRLERYWGQIKKQKEQQINLSARLAALGTLAAGVAHEINNPIAIILGFTDLLLEGEKPGTKVYEQLKIIERQGLACKKIVENLNRFARVPEQAAETADVNEELQRMVEMVQNTLLTEKVRVVTELEPGLPRVIGEPHGLQQVLLNLVTNARAAMRDGGVLTLRTRRTGEWVEIAVSDTGQGIRQDDLERIFDPFFTTKAPGEGTGLGLSISHGIIENAGGTITVTSVHESEAGGQPSGSTFVIRLRTAPPEEEA
ncbi:MAG: sensor histidine kinase [Acidobacteriota bacterium]